MTTKEIEEKWVGIAVKLLAPATKSLRAKSFSSRFEQDAQEALVSAFLTGVIMAIKIQKDGGDLKELLKTKFAEAVKMEHLGHAGNGQNLN